MKRKMNLAVRLSAGMLAMTAVVWGTPTLAADIICANPLVAGQTRQYQTSGAEDCVWIPGVDNIGQGQPLNDAFLNGLGVNDAAYGQVDVNGGATAPGPEEFGLLWTTIDSVNFSNNAFPNFTGLTFANVTSRAFNWTLTDTSYDRYALGLVDGQNPKSTVFLLNDTSGLAQIISQGGDWSHVVLYGADDGDGPPQQVPEPAALVLMGLGLMGLAAVRRRRS